MEKKRKIICKLIYVIIKILWDDLDDEIKKTLKEAMISIAIYREVEK